MILAFLTLTVCVLIPLILLIIFRTNIGVLFLATCTGIVLLQSLDPAVVTTASAVLPGDGESIIRVAVVVMSLTFAAMMFRHAIASSQYLLHGILCIIVGIVLWLVLPVTSGLSLLVDAADSELWQNVNEFRTLIIATGFSLSLLAILMAKPPKHEKGKHH